MAGYQKPYQQTGGLKNLLLLKKYNFSFEEIKLLDEIDTRSVISILKAISEKEEEDDLSLSLCIANAVNMATGAIHSKKNANAFNAWRRKLVNRINKLRRKKQRTVWDNMSSRKSKRL